MEKPNYMISDEIEDFNRHKRNALMIQEMIADALEWKGERDKADRVRRCGTYMLLNRYADLDNIRRIQGANFCKNSICPFCSWRKSLLRTAVMQRAMSTLTKEQEANLYLVTLTVVNKPYIDKQYIQSLMQAATAFVRNHYVTKNYIASGEITWSSQGGYHPHVHILMLSKRAAQSLRSKSSLRYAWASWLRHAGLLPERVFWQMADIRRAQQGTAAEVAKYIAKVVSYDADRAELFDVICCLLESTRNVRLWRPSGIFRVAQKEGARILGEQRQEEKEFLAHFEPIHEWYAWLEDAYYIVLPGDQPPEIEDEYEALEKGEDL